MPITSSNLAQKYILVLPFWLLNMFLALQLSVDWRFHSWITFTTTQSTAFHLVLSKVKHVWNILINREQICQGKGGLALQAVPCTGKTCLHPPVAESPRVRPGYAVRWGKGWRDEGRTGKGGAQRGEGGEGSKISTSSEEGVSMNEWEIVAGFLGGIFDRLDKHACQQMDGAMWTGWKCTLLYKN